MLISVWPEERQLLIVNDNRKWDPLKKTLVRVLIENRNGPVSQFFHQKPYRVYTWTKGKSKVYKYGYAISMTTWPEK